MIVGTVEHSAVINRMEFSFLCCWKKNHYDMLRKDRKGTEKFVIIMLFFV